MQMTKTNPPLPSFLFFCSRPNFLDLLPLSVPIFSSLEQILIKVKRYEPSGAIAAIFCFQYN